MAKPTTADLVSEEDLKIAASVLKDKYDVGRIVLFGSKAVGRASRDSDIDLCILIKSSTKKLLDVRRAMRREVYPIIHAPMDILLYEEEAFYDRAAAGVSLEAEIDRNGIDL
jgi:predicted nucleotidyltransferase